jgi:galactonate dehydratase
VQPVPAGLTISTVRAIPLTAQMQAGTRTSQAVYDKVSIVLVELHTTDGIVGYGECLGRFGAQAYASFINEVLAPLLLGRSAFDIRQHWIRMRAALTGRAGGILIEAIAGVDIALWDVVGKALQQPVHRLLGGMGRTVVDCYASSINWADAATMQAQTRAVLAMGFTSIKVKLGQPVDQAIAAAAAVREVAGSGVRLGVDANWALFAGRPAHRRGSQLQAAQEHVAAAGDVCVLSPARLAADISPIGHQPLSRCGV